MPRGFGKCLTSVAEIRAPTPACFLRTHPHSKGCRRRRSLLASRSRRRRTARRRSAARAAALPRPRQRGRARTRVLRSLGTRLSTLDSLPTADFARRYILILIDLGACCFCASKAPACFSPFCPVAGTAAKQFLKYFIFQMFFVCQHRPAVNTPNFVFFF